MVPGTNVQVKEVNSYPLPALWDNLGLPNKTMHTGCYRSRKSIAFVKTTVFHGKILAIIDLLAVEVVS